jgi:phosphatidylglycerophosphate synthase
LARHASGDWGELEPTDVFTLGVSFAAGVFFALGGYWSMLTGAVLGWLSSVLDGCDGEVARLKLQESAFGCWLETMCDNLYYLFIFGGLTIELVRNSGNRTYLVWGGVLVFGAIASFLTTGLQRHQLASGHPEPAKRPCESTRSESSGLAADDEEHLSGPCTI